MKRDYDVIVVGGGPAGATAAFEAARIGCRVALVDRSVRIGTPVRCGELIRTASLHGFVDPAPPLIVTRFHEYRIVAPNGLAIHFKEQDMGCLLDRRWFDQALVDKAIDAGTTMFTEANVVDLLRHGSTPTGVILDYRGRRRPLTSRLVIGADGVASRVGRFAGLRTTLSLRQFASTAFAVACDSAFDRPRCDLHFGRSVAPGGYVWVFAKGDGSANVGAGVGARFLARRTAADYLREFVTQHFPTARLATVRAGGIPIAAPLTEFVGDGIMLAGDAARQTNPLTGAGIHMAMLSGQLCGRIGGRRALDGDVSASALREYQNLWWETCGAFHRTSRDMRQRLDRTDDAALSLAAERIGVESHSASVAGAIAQFVAAAAHTTAA